MRAPLLGAITLNPTGGGIALVSALLWRVIQNQWGADARLITMFDHDNRPATFVEKTRFTVRLAGTQAASGTDWILFSHLALARIQPRIPRRLRRPYGVFLHGIEAWKALSEADLRALAAADVRMANSRFTADRVMAMHPTIGHVEPCPLALPPARDEADGPFDRAIVGQLGPHAVLVVGRMLQSERYKGHDELIAAWPAVMRRVPDAQLVVVGQGDDSGRLQQTARAAGLGASVIFTGFVSRATLHTLYERSTLFALPSRGEGFGLVYLEAMSHRLPCVGSIHDAATEVIDDGVTGRLLAQDDISGLAEAIASLLLNPQQRHTMGEAGHARASKTFSFDRFSSRIRELLEGAERAHADAG